MPINYDFIAYSNRTSPTSWTLGMKAIQGEVPLDIVIPDEPVSPPNPDAPEIVGVLTTEGLERESSDGLELYRYLRRLNPKKNETFEYNEIVIRNIQSRLNTLRVNEELRVQITYTERKEPYTPFSYQVKLIGIFGNAEADAPTHEEDENATLQPSEKQAQPEVQRRTSSSPEKSVYKTTNTLEKLIAFTQNLQRELTQTRRELAVTVDKVAQLENERQHFRELRDLVQDILDRLAQLEAFEPRIQYLEADRQHLHELQETLQKFLMTLNRQTQILLQEHNNQDEVR